MYPTYPYPFAPNAEETYVHFDFDLVDWVTEEVAVQWLRPFIIIGAARETILSGISGSQVFFRNTSILHRCLIRDLPQEIDPRDFIGSHIEAGGLLRGDDRVLWIIDSELSLDHDEPETHTVTYCVLVSSQSGTDYP